MSPGLEHGIIHAMMTCRDANGDCFVGLVQEGELHVVIYLSETDNTFPLPEDVYRTFELEERDWKGEYQQEGLARLAKGDSTDRH